MAHKEAIQQKLRPGSSSKNLVNMNATLDPNFQKNKRSNVASSQKVNKCLDTTITTTSRMNSTMNVSVPVDSKFNLDCTYTKYLQSLLKQQIIVKKVQAYENVLLGQISQQYETVHTMLKKYTEMSDEVEKVSKLAVFNDLKQTVQSTFEKCDLLEKYHALKRELNTLIVKLNRYCNETVFKNVKPISPQDCTEISKLLQLYNRYLEMNLSEAHSAQVHSLAESINRLNEVQDRIFNLYNILSNLSENASYRVLEDSSDFFARGN